MARVKPKRHGVSLDMTAMCDVAFLLLTFFILTTQFKKADAEEIKTPTSKSDTKLSDKDVMTINITPDGRPLYTPIDNKEHRLELLDKMAGKYQVGLTDANKKTFAILPAIGVSMAELKSYLDLPEDKRAAFKATGIPMDSVKTELTDWVNFSRDIAPQGQLTIKGDAKAQYPKFKDLFEGLKEIKYNQFTLITSAE
jgi:biopolymer transport protein ExbD